MTPDTFPTVETYLLTKLPEIKARIAELRDQRCHLTASIMRDEMLNQIETWLDPAGTAHTRELQAIQGRAAVALSRQIDPACGF